VRIVAALILCASLFVAPQQRPDFSGDWILVSGSGRAPGGFSVNHGGDGRMTIVQDAHLLKVMWVSYSRNHKPVQSVVDLDGATRQFIDRNSIDPQERTTRARWDGKRLVITTHFAGRDGGGAPNQPPIDTEEIVLLESASTLRVSVKRVAGSSEMRGTRLYRRE
jgi:hypothetical protein